MIYYYANELLFCSSTFLKGDGESTPEATPDEMGDQQPIIKTPSSPSKSEKKRRNGKTGASSGKGALADLPTLEVTCNFHLLPMILFVVALGTRFYALDQPNSIVFDELHYGRYAGLYQKQTFFFDSHPPLGKQLLALAGYLGGFQGLYNRFLNF